MRITGWRPTLSERRIALLGGDLAALSCALFLALWIRPAILDAPWLPFLQRLQPHWWLVLAAIWAPLAIILGCYDLRLARAWSRSVPLCLAAVLLGCLAYLLVPLIAAPLTRSRLSWFLFLALAGFGVASWRIVYATLFSQPSFVRYPIIVGQGEAALALARAIDRQGATGGILLLGFVGESPAGPGLAALGKPLLGPCHQLDAIVRQVSASEVVVALAPGQGEPPELITQLTALGQRGIPVFTALAYYEETTGRVPVSHLGGELLSALRPRSPAQNMWLAARRLLDLGVGLVGLVFCALLLAPLAAAIWGHDRGPVFYRQQRVGRYGRPFPIVKFRTMAPQSEPAGPAWALPADARVTPIGRLLRRTHLDELPQCWNILLGHMSLIGPRPERPEFVAALSAELPAYAVRHSIRPGLTGWAQVRYPYGSSLDDARQKLEYDLYYLKHAGPLLDMAILLRTVRAILLLKGR